MCWHIPRIPEEQMGINTAHYLFISQVYGSSVCVCVCVWYDRALMAQRLGHFKQNQEGTTRL